AVSFGAEALSHQAKESAEDNNWRLAKDIKLHLHPDDMKVKHGLKLDPLPHGVSLHQIYSDFSAYLLKHTRSFSEDRIFCGRMLWEKPSPNIEVVIAHPNGWGIREQGFLRGAAVKAGFASASSPHKIRFVTEAEAILHFFIYHTNFGSYPQIGTRFAVCDAGGSTVDTAVYSVVGAPPSLKPEEVRASACIQAGAIFVDAAAEKYIRSVLSGASLPEEDVLEYTARGVKDFSVVKRDFRDATQDKLIEIAGSHFNNPSIRTRRGRMTISGAIIKSFFDVCLREIMASVDQQIQGLSASLILLIGEFGDIPYLQREFKTRSDTPAFLFYFISSSKAVADGAVIWGVASNRPQSEYDSLLSQLQPQEDYFKELRLLDAAMREKDSKLRELDQAYERLTQELVEICQQVERVQSEHTSLRSQFQPRENIDLNEIVQTLKDLNGEVADVGRLISEYLTDTYVQKTFGKDPSDVTVLDAIYVPELKALLGHVDGRSSLVASWDHEEAIPAEDFLDYATRSLLCEHLYRGVFAPFHPAINSSQSGAIISMYHGIQQQETQNVAAKWRANCFKDIYKPRITDAAAYHVGVIAREFVCGSLSPLLNCFFGEKAGVELENQHLDRLNQLFRTAWDWNSVLKGDIILQGDFHPTYYGPLHRFDPDVMSEFEPNPLKPQPEYILGTLGLGLLSSHAVGGGKGPEEAVVYKATVATKSLYA
ncbi:hypothetical protein FRC10_006063, partial [Ceratobasidium sp. 414]